jgi:hypothetical protein
MASSGIRLMLAFQRCVVVAPSRAEAGIAKRHLPRLGLVRLAQAAIELQDVGNAFRDLVAGAVTADDEVFRPGFGAVLCSRSTERLIP